MSLNYLAQNNSDEISFCPTAGCNYMCFYDKNEYHLECPLCQKSYCLKCKTEWHENLTCEENQLSLKGIKNQEDEINFEEYAKGCNFKKCPNCKRWVEKNEGCDHIKCLFGTHFCYSCGEIRDPERPYEHNCPNNRHNGNFMRPNNMFMFNNNLNILPNMIMMNNMNMMNNNIFNRYLNQDLRYFNNMNMNLRQNINPNFFNNTNFLERNARIYQVNNNITNINMINPNNNNLNNINMINLNNNNFNNFININRNF